MKIRIIKNHAHYNLGVHDVIDERANYLIKMGVAEVVVGIIPHIENKVLPTNVEIKRRGVKSKIKS